MASSHIPCRECDGYGGVDNVRCDNCGGHGFFVRCRACGGDGWAWDTSSDFYGQTVDCKPCKGSGKLYAFGEGEVTRAS